MEGAAWALGAGIGKDRMRSSVVGGGYDAGCVWWCFAIGAGTNSTCSGVSGDSDPEDEDSDVLDGSRGGSGA